MLTFWGVGLSADVGELEGVEGSTTMPVLDGVDGSTTVPVLDGVEGSTTVPELDGVEGMTYADAKLTCSRQSLCVVNDQPVGNPKRKV
jgi:hypothetical protein